MSIQSPRPPNLWLHPRAMVPRLALAIGMCLALSAPAWAATTVPMEVQMPGSQPGDAGNMESVDKCDNCHQDNDPVVNIAHDWRGSMMAHAGRDPIYWATVAIAEQDFDGAGDLCIRCHTMTNPDDSEHVGAQVPPFVANDGAEGYYGSA